jgi:hypothetical protein
MSSLFSHFPTFFRIFKELFTSETLNSSPVNHQSAFQPISEGFSVKKSTILMVFTKTFQKGMQKAK